MKSPLFQAAALGALLALASVSHAAPMAVRGTVEAADASSITVKDRSGEVVKLAVSPTFRVNEVYPVALSSIQSNSYIGVGALPQADGTLQALFVTVFPEEARGTGEGFRNWDSQPGATMTNATVTGMASAATGRSLTLTYKDGAKQVDVPENVPVVSFKPGDMSLIKPGAKVNVTADTVNGVPTALRALAGRDGFQPPQ